jgi:hypothetical protein
MSGNTISGNATIENVIIGDATTEEATIRGRDERELVGFVFDFWHGLFNHSHPSRAAIVKPSLRPLRLPADNEWADGRLREVAKAGVAPPPNTPSYFQPKPGCAGRNTSGAEMFMRGNASGYNPFPSLSKPGH